MHTSHLSFFCTRVNFMFFNQPLNPYNYCISCKVQIWVVFPRRPFPAQTVFFRIRVLLVGIQSYNVKIRTRFRWRPEDRSEVFVNAQSKWNRAPDLLLPRAVNIDLDTELCFNHIKIKTIHSDIELEWLTVVLNCVDRRLSTIIIRGHKESVLQSLTSTLCALPFSFSAHFFWVWYG